MTITQHEIEGIMTKSRRWMIGEEGGERATLSGRDLRGAVMCFACLANADLSDADMTSANLRFANLKSANMRYANMRRALLGGADLRDADLSGADLRDAYLGDANIAGAELCGATLSQNLPRVGELWWIQHVGPHLLSRQRNLRRSGRDYMQTTAIWSESFGLIWLVGGRSWVNTTEMLQLVNDPDKRSCYAGYEHVVDFVVNHPALLIIQNGGVA